MTVLSIDWDFFFYRAFETNLECKVNDRSLGCLFDWGHSEAHSEALQRILWITRFQAFLQAGVDPRQITRHGCMSPKLFASELLKRIENTNYSLAYSESHLHGYKTICEIFDENYEEPLSVIHFDAHHDLGYGSKERNEEGRLTEYDCSNWLLAALEQGMVSDLTVVYPDWRGRYEIESDNLAHLEYYNIQFTTWTEWKEKTQQTKLDVSAIHLARSGAWVPPWFDKEFEEFMFSLNAVTFTCIECEEADSRTAHACTPRKWEDPPALEDMLQIPIPENRDV